MGFDITITRITNQQLLELEACAARLHEENQASASICAAEIYEQADDFRVEHVSDTPELTGNPWLDDYLAPASLPDQSVMLGMSSGELTDNPLLSYFLPFEAYYDPTDHTQLTTSAPFEAYYAAAEPIDYPTYPDINEVYKQVSAVLEQRKGPDLGYIATTDIDPQQAYYALSATIHLWEPVETCMETLVAEQKLPDWPIKIFAEDDHQTACIGDLHFVYSTVYRLQAVEVPLYLHALKQLPPRLFKRYFFMQRLMNRERNDALLMPFFCWESRMVEKLILLFEQAARDQDWLVWYTW
ncbi:MAG TPA: hypothetical protein DEF47_21615 [Herpetosiphon sp.]|uniref:DUF4253 domain-containing protein n=1 Tax=Herpetosiphon aurantiacus (strain ATCC 23779 / DSM 785 / 114-95) TaxID=316274 RepID=A9AX06_HERA2|nr:hypothetical protein [Herpetosiphon sp.]ABX04814.1 hypothetical protein Haur_2174 [Herpetosiphon aurantiacus DSM 785]HBW52490.1 hypothetical protein [Herpetosiphon sp.]